MNMNQYIDVEFCTISPTIPVTFCSSHAVTSSVIYYSTDAQRKLNLFVLYCKKVYINEEKTRENILLKYITPSDDVICACVL